MQLAVPPVAEKWPAAHTSHTTCSQSRAAFMTGWPTHVNGHRSLWSLVRDSEPNILRYLHDDGYDVYWWGKNDNLEDTALLHSTRHNERGRGSDHNRERCGRFNQLQGVACTTTKQHMTRFHGVLHDLHVLSC